MAKRIKCMIILCLMAVATLLTGIFTINAPISNVYAEAKNGFSFADGASVKTDNIGIRFTVSVDETLSNTLFNVNTNKIATSFKSANTKVGMIVVPKQALDNAEKAAGDSAVNYMTYLTSTLGMNKSAVAVEFTFESRNIQYNIDKTSGNPNGSHTLKGAIVGLKDANLKYEYQAVAYYTLDNGTTYVYSARSDARDISTIADAYLTSGGEIDGTVKTNLQRVVVRTVAMKELGSASGISEDEGEFALDMTSGDGTKLLTGKAFAISDLVRSYDSFTLTDTTGDISYDETSVTLTGKGGATLNVSAYDGLVSYKFKLVNEPFLDIITDNAGTASTTYQILCDYPDNTSATYIADSKTGRKIWGMLNHELYRTEGWGTGPNGSKNTYYAASIFNHKTTLPSVYSSSDKYIVFGNNSYLTLAYNATHNEELNYTAFTESDDYTENTYKIVCQDNSIFVIGSRSALRFGVYGLLNIMIGYETISLDTTGLSAEIYFEEMDELSLAQSEINLTYVPDYEYCQGFFAGSVYSQSNGASVQKSASMGFVFGSQYSTGNSSNDDGVTASLQYNITAEHNTFGYFPLALYNDSSKTSTYHPEWFAHDTADSVDVYRNSPKQVCFYELCDGAYATEALARAMAVVKAHKSNNYISMSNRDEGGFCSCSHCAGEGDRAYYYIKFLNKLATAMAEDDETKHMTLEGMVYSVLCAHPPIDGEGDARIQTVDNLRLVFAFNRADYYAGLTTADREYLAKWNKVCTRWVYWTYCFRPNYEMFFFDDFTNKQVTYSTLLEYGAEGIMDEGNKSCQQGTNFNSLRCYVISKLANDAGVGLTDAEAEAYYESILDRYFTLYFGPAADDMRDIFDAQRQMQQTANNNWESLVSQGLNANIKASFGGWTNSTALGEYGNPLLGTYSSNAFHFYASRNHHGNRYLLSLIQSKSQIEGLLTSLNSAFTAVANSDLSASRKAEINARIRLEQIGIMYQYLFIYSDSFAIGNNSYAIATGSGTEVAVADLQTYLGCNSIKAAEQLFASLCGEFGISSVSYTTINKLASAWGLDDGTIEDPEW